ncbi:MAG: NUDIX domain-containing protein [Treponema sp.]|nr:NUDIX domain-containing protein [Treponema sp.]
MELWDLYDSQRRPLNKTHERGQTFADGEFYVCAEIWVKNSEGKFLITKRHPDKKAGNLWEFTGGGTLAGETTLQSAVRELEEESGIKADESELKLFATYQKKNYFQDLFTVCKDIDISDIRLQPGENTEARWASPEEIQQMIDKGEFVYSVGLRFGLYRDKV